MKTTIQDFHLDDKSIEVDVKYNEREFTIEIDAHKFEAWLLENDKLSWTTDQPQNGEHVQKTGVMTLDEYWTIYHKYINADLLKFIRSNPVECNGITHENLEAVMKWLRNERYDILPISRVA
jgi:hypothetical protein